MAEWWRDYFDESFFQLHEPLFNEADSRREAAAILDLLALPTSARVLDVPCGWGRHTTLLADAVDAAFGADISLPLLERAAAASRSADQPVRYAAADLRELPFRDQSFDAVLNVFTSLGLFLDDDEDVRALREAARVLRPGGALLLESMHRDDVIGGYAERDRWKLPDGTKVQMRRRFDPVSGISYEKMRWRMTDGSGGEKRHALRLRTATEIDGLLARAGFTGREYFGSWEGAPFRHDSLHVIIVARGG